MSGGEGGAEGAPPRWTRLEIDPLGIVDSFTVFSLAELNDGLKELIHKIVNTPAALLDQLEARWSSGEVQDLLLFLARPQIQVLLTQDATDALNQFTLDAVYAGRGLDTSLALENVPEAARNIADVRETLVAKDVGYQLLKKQPNSRELLQALVGTAGELLRPAQERFFELWLDKARGRVGFE